MRPPGIGWALAAAISLATLVVGIAVGRPDATRVAVSEVRTPQCVGESWQTALGNSDTVFTGTVTSTTDKEVRLDADRFYAGAVNFRGFPAVVYRQGWDGITWTPGNRYIVISNGGRLRECGQTQPWNAPAAEALRAFYR